MTKLTRAQQKALEEINETGFLVHKTAFGRSQSNRAAWKLVELGLAEFDWGPRDSFLQMQGFLPTENGRK